jgi:hypothetical protein
MTYREDPLGALLDDAERYPADDMRRAYRSGVYAGYDLGRREMAQHKELEMQHLRAQLEKLIEAGAALFRLQVPVPTLNADGNVSVGAKRNAMDRAGEL